MKKSSKRICGMFMISGGLLMSGLAFPSFADSTGTVQTGTIVSTGTYGFAGSLTGYIQTQKNLVANLFNASYQRVYTTLSMTGIAIIKTLDYQSLVCLGVLPGQSLLAQLQQDKLSFENAFTKDFVELENKVENLEEENVLQQQNGIDMFNGSTYQDEKDALKTEIDATVQLHEGFIQTFETGYMSKIHQFINDFAEYDYQNKNILTAVGAKIAKVQYVLSGFKNVDALVAHVYDALSVTDIMTKLDGLKATAINNLALKIDPVIALKLKLYPTASNISGNLSGQKATTIQQYQQAMENYFNTAFNQWFDRAKYIQIRDKIAAFKKTYFTNQSLNCSNVIATSDDTGIALLSQDISGITANITSGLTLAKTAAGLSGFKANLVSGFQALYTTTLQQKFTDFQNAIKSYLNGAVATIQNVISSITVTTGSSAGSGFVSPAGFTFTKPFTLLQKGDDVKILEQFLTSQGVYSGAIDGVFTYPVKDALFQYQLNKGILTASSKSSLHGLLGPATRKVINALLK